MIHAEKLFAAGIDYNAGLTRFMEDAALYEAVLAAFLSENPMDSAQAAFDNHDRQALERIAHTAKGSCGNAGLNTLSQKAEKLVTLLRSSNCTDEALSSSFHTFLDEYRHVYQAIGDALQ